ncbi:MAG: hypothetical protein WCD76_01710 [Pyrinomonadaceae bacterium]
MGDLKNVADVIMRKLEDGSLPVTTEESQSFSGKTPIPFSGPRALRPSMDENLTEAQRNRRATIMLEVVQRYIFDKHLDPLPIDELRAVLKSYDHLFTAAGIPTDRIRDVYAEAMNTHGQYLLRVDDYLRAWDRLKPQEYAGVDVRPMSARGNECALCGGTGMSIRYDSKTDTEFQSECPYHCRPIGTNLQHSRSGEEAREAVYR